MVVCCFPYPPFSPISLFGLDHRQKLCYIDKEVIPMGYLLLALLLAFLALLPSSKEKVPRPCPGAFNFRLSNSCKGSTMTQFPSGSCPDILVDLHSVGAVEIVFTLESNGAPFGKSIFFPGLAEPTDATPGLHHGSWGTGTFCANLCCGYLKNCPNNLLPDGIYTITCAVGGQIVGTQAFQIGPG
jgi:hypothetical protein